MHPERRRPARTRAVRVISEKKLKQQQEERQTHVHHIVYTVLAVLVVLFGVGLLIWNSNFFQSRAAAVTIDGQDYTAADVQYYYNGALQQEIYNSYSGASTMDYTLDPEDPGSTTSPPARPGATICWTWPSRP